MAVSFVDRMRRRFSPAWKGSRGIRLVSPMTHFTFYAIVAYLYYYIVTEERTPIFVIEKPPVPAPPPPPGTMSFEASCQMNYRLGRDVSATIGGVIKPMDQTK